MSHDFPFTKDNRIVLQIYAGTMGVSGSLIALFGWSWMPHDLLGIPFAMASLVRVLGTAMVASGCWAAMLSQTGDPELRRKGLRWFAAAHFAVLLMLHLQCIAVWPPVISSGIETGIRPEFGIILFMLIHSESYFIDRNTGIPAVPPADDSSIEPVRTAYERQIRRAGAQEERNRLARDLHDSIKQQIFVIQTAAATAQARFDNDHSGAAQALVQIRNSARDAMTEMEVMMDQLRAVPLENASLVAALNKLCEALGHRTGAHVDFRLGDLPPNDELAPGAHQAILRVAQEACANIGRHARAKNVTVSLGSASGELELRIYDDGIGFQPLGHKSGMGIENMRTRAKEIGGRFNLNSSPGGGATVVFSIPRSAILSAGHRREYIQQALMFAAVFAAVFAFMPPAFRPFTWKVWCIAGLGRIIQAVRAHRRARQSRLA